MTPEKQKQFEEEHRLVIAVAAQLGGDPEDAVEAAIRLIRYSEKCLKEFYESTEQPKAPTPEAQPEPPVPAPLPPRPSRKVVEESISAASQVILAKKLRRQEQLVEMLQAYGVRAKAQLNDEQAVELMNKLKEIIK